MTEQNERLNVALGQIVQSALADFPGVQRLNGMDSLRLDNNRLRINITLCPLYAQGSMDESELLHTGGAVAESRVTGKWHAGIQLAKVVQQALSISDISLHVQFTFADLGVILNNPTDEDRERLVRHRVLYGQAAQEALEATGITWDFQSYSELGIEFPMFVEPTKELVEGSRRINIVDQLFHELYRQVPLAGSSIFVDPKTDEARFSKKARKIIGSLVNAFGIELTRLFLLQYGTFDAITSRSGDINCYLERGELLLNVTNLFLHGNDPERSRVDIKI